MTSHGTYKTKCNYTCTANNVYVNDFTWYVQDQINYTCTANNVYVNDYVCRFDSSSVLIAYSYLYRVFIQRHLKLHTKNFIISSKQLSCAL